MFKNLKEADANVAPVITVVVPSSRILAVASVNASSNILTTVNLGACLKYSRAVCDVKY